MINVHDHSRVIYDTNGEVVAWINYNGTAYMPPCPEAILQAHPFRLAFMPIIADQDGTSLIGVARRGATVTNREKFNACVAETDRIDRAHQLMQRAFITGKTIAQLKRDDRYWRWLGIVALIVSGAITLFTLGVLFSWAIKGHP